MKKTGTKKPKTVSASELAQMGVCERLVVFEHRYGKRPTPEQRQAIRRGLNEHERFYQEGIDAAAKRGRCYIATIVFGESRETSVLRQYRERTLRPYRTGRWVIKSYYRTAPAICRCLVRWPWLQPVIRRILRPIVWLVERWLEDIGDKHAI